MIDTHAHLNFKNFTDDLDEVMRQSLQKGIERIIIPGSTVGESKRAIEIAEKYDNVFAGVGIHPEDAEAIKDFDEIEKLASHKKVVAIGETGLDYSYPGTDTEEAREKQKELLKKHLELARKMSLPLIFHNRDSDEDFYEVIKNYKGEAVVHCFTGDWDFAKKILDLGFLISFTGIITFDKTGNLARVIRETPLEKIMVETDAPFLAPVPYRGKRAEPWMVREIVQKIADIKRLSFEEVDEKTTVGAKKFFDI
ncbi:TatD family deoxyribonuclease [candidate division WS5 bacterium]|uniref:TatD family deoxyribonuclease n=1 Tax=candidate division WS5 bacterium TaxID=2093353 RepID=A0A419DG15_9BACT|nr:MAG: TatD family deoxyribonuclease [candidate division WS5 bacterium]